MYISKKALKIQLPSTIFRQNESNKKFTLVRRYLPHCSTVFMFLL